MTHRLFAAEGVHNAIRYADCCSASRIDAVRSAADASSSRSRNTGNTRRRDRPITSGPPDQLLWHTITLDVLVQPFRDDAVALTVADEGAVAEALARRDGRARAGDGRLGRGGKTGVTRGVDRSSPPDFRQVNATIRRRKPAQVTHACLRLLKAAGSQQRNYAAWTRGIK